MKRGFLVAAGGAAIVAVALSGCGEDKPAPTKSPSAATSSSAASTSASAAPGNSKVIIDGEDQKATANPICADVGSDYSITIGDPPSATTVLLTKDEPPKVKTVAFASLSNGLLLGVNADGNQGNAEVAKDGKTYKITGTATGFDASQLKNVDKPFEITATCS